MPLEIEAVALALKQTGCIEFRDEEKGEELFVLRGGGISNFYINLRRIKSFPTEKALVVDAYEEMAENLKYDRIADIPTAVTPLISSLCDRLSESQITPRPPKDHGLPTSIEGDYNPGDIILVGEDLVTSGTSILEGVDILRTGGLIVNDVIALVDREQGGRANLEAAGLKFHNFMTWREMMTIYLDNGLVTQKLFDKTVPKV